jgi:hypothetical protein
MVKELEVVLDRVSKNSLVLEISSVSKKSVSWQKLASHQEPALFQKTVLCQGTTSVVPKKPAKPWGFSP